MILSYDAYSETIEGKQSEIKGLQDKYDRMESKFDQILSMIQQNPKLAGVKKESISNVCSRPQLKCSFLIIFHSVFLVHNDLSGSLDPGLHWPPSKNLSICGISVGISSSFSLIHSQNLNQTRIDEPCLLSMGLTGC